MDFRNTSNNRCGLGCLHIKYSIFYFLFYMNNIKVFLFLKGFSFLFSIWVAITETSYSNVTIFETGLPLEVWGLLLIQINASHWPLT